jgi:shikimate kinase/nucleoside-diphosphate-sugar epimerase
MMPREPIMFLIIGCGYVGERLADMLHAAQHEVVGVTHSADSAARLTAAKPYPVYTCDVSDGESVSALTTRLSVNPSVIVHCASSNRGGAEMYRKVYLDGCRNLQRTFPGAHLVFTSSSSVYPQTDGSWVNEESEAIPDRETSRILREAEELVLANGGCVARLAGIYGPARSFVLKNFLEGTASIEGNDGEGRYLNQIHREDAASALMQLSVLKEKGIYNIVDDQPMTQRECFVHLAEKFARPMPPISEPKTERKRAWTHKRISNAKLHGTGWSPLYESYFAALERDTELVPSIMAQVTTPEPPTERGCNIVIVGLMGCGKTSVGRICAQMLGFDFVDTDQVITSTAGRSIPDIFSNEGEAGFRKRETEALQALVGKSGLVIATGGGIVTQADNLPLLKTLGFVVWLSADPGTLHRRTAHSNDRPLLRNGDPEATLRNLYESRKALYEAVADMKITTDDLSLEDVAYGLAESAKLHFRHHV